MISRAQTFYLTLFATSFLIHAVPASAQEEPIKKMDPCLVIAEEIVPLRVPDFEQTAMWKKTNGVKGEDKARAILAVADGGQIIIGQGRRYDDKTGWGDQTIAVTRTDKTGKIVVSTWVPIKGLWSVNDAVLMKDKIAIVVQTGADGKASGAGLQTLNGIGEPLKFYPLADGARRVIPHGVITTQGSKSLAVVAQTAEPKNNKDVVTAIFWLDDAGRPVMQKTYLPGVPTKPDSITRLQGGNIAVTGRVGDSDGREAGWVMRTSADGNIIWQRPYARGTDATIRAAAPYPDGQIITIGDTIPNQGGDKAAWVMRLDPKGNIVWQKYLTGKYEYSGVDVLTLPDGRIQALLAGKPSSFGGREFARIVTLSAEGQIIGDESYIEGSNAIPARFIVQNGYRYLTGVAETGFSQGNTPPERKYVTYDLWMIGLPSLPPYRNTCGAAPERQLDDLP